MYIGAAAISLVLLVSVGAVAALALNDGFGFFGGSEAGGRDLYGEWSGTSSDGQDVTATFASDGAVEIAVYDVAMVGTYELDTNREPSLLYTDWGEPGRAEYTLEFIYDDRIRLEKNGPGKEFPTAFSEGSIVLTRVGPDSAGAESEGGATNTEAASEPRIDEERLEQFGYEYHGANRRGDWGTMYAMLDEESQAEFAEEEWAEKQQVVRDSIGLPAPLESISVDLEEGDSDAPATVTLLYEDGTQEDLTVSTDPATTDQSDDGGPKLILSDLDISYMRGVPTDGESAQGDTAQAQQEIFRSEAEAAAEDYYRAVEAGDFDYTYDHLDSETRSAFKREEWLEKNGWFAGSSPVVYEVESVVLDDASDEPLANVSVKISAEDGSSSFDRDTFWVYEDGQWLHRFTQEEYDVYMPGVSYEEFVAARDTGG